ncbi:MAG: pyridoxamine 5'-phosphate oxidase [Candidatus Dormibacteria bacterium]
MTEKFPKLGQRDVAPDPLAQFERWFAEASSAQPLAEAAALATADGSGRPSQRMVLVKGWGAGGFDFYSNYLSRKGGELATNPWAALLFYWPQLGRQVRIEGPVQQLDSANSDHYFASRPRASQLGAVASAQSRPIIRRAELDRRVSELEGSLAGGPVPRPEWWGGYRLQAVGYEFWQHREDRLHDRIRYVLEPPGWRRERLQP